MQQFFIPSHREMLEAARRLKEHHRSMQTDISAVRPDPRFTRQSVQLQQPAQKYH